MKADRNKVIAANICRAHYQRAYEAHVMSGPPTPDDIRNYFRQHIDADAFHNDIVNEVEVLKWCTRLWGGGYSEVGV